MKQFKDFNIKPTYNGMEGDKININKLLNREIVVHKHYVKDSKYGDGSRKCLHMQIEFQNERRVVFIGSNPLIEVIEKVAKEDFPFKTTIIKQNGRLEFS